MRLWSLHPAYLDAKGIVALWREALLAQKVLQGRTRGYRHHPQLQRFKQTRDPKKAMATYLRGVWEDAERRGYHFDAKKIGRPRTKVRISVTQGQMRYELDWLCRKLKTRDPLQYRRIRSSGRIKSHPLFIVKPGPIESWERDKEFN